jgi:hypothetical protein
MTVMNVSKRSGRGGVAGAVKVPQTSDMTTPLARAQAKLQELERELGKHPDFQFYLLAKTEQDRTRMEAMLISIPAFGLWHKLRSSIALAAQPSRALAE